MHYETGFSNAGGILFDKRRMQQADARKTARLTFSFGWLLGWPVAACLQIALSEPPSNEQPIAEADKD